jgi:hypothetical protein
MGFDFEKLKQDFDAAAAAQPCEVACEPAADEEGFVATMQKYMLAPAKCGVYYSRLDIKVIGLRFGEDVQVRQRAWMLRDILRAVTSKERLEELFGIIREVGEEKIAVYDELAALFPHSEPIFLERKEQFAQFLRVMEEIAKEFEDVE